jgi:hypothetical protein
MYSDTQPLLHDNKQARSPFRQVFATNSFNLIVHAEDETLAVVLRLYSTGVRIKEIGRFDVEPQRYTCSQAEAFTNALKMTLKHLNDNYSWQTPTMRRVRQDAQPFLNFCLNREVDLREYPNL